MISIVKRNLKIFFRDKAAVFFSLLGVIIIIGLYVLFLGDTVQSGLENIPGARFLMDSWIMAGLMAVSSITTTMGAFGIMVDDKSKKLLRDFTASPLSRKSIAGGYIISSFVIGMIMSFITFIFAEIYIVASGGRLLSFSDLLLTLGCIFLAVMSSSSIVFLITTFIKSANAFATASTVLGTLIGFLTGVYIPIGILPDAVQYVIKMFPVSHAASLMRQIVMAVPIKESFAAATPEEIIAFKDNFGVTFFFGNTELSWATSILMLLGTTIIFYALAILKLSRKEK